MVNLDGCYEFQQCTSFRQGHLGHLGDLHRIADMRTGAIAYLPSHWDGIWHFKKQSICDHVHYL